MEQPYRIRFGTDGWRDHRDEFTHERVRAVGDAYSRYLLDEGLGGRPVAVGYDARTGADAIAEVLADRAVTAGFDVWLATRDCPTPAVASAIEGFELAGGFMVTASHNPPADLGIKLIPAGGAPATESVTDRVESLLEDVPPPQSDAPGVVEPFDFIDLHIETVIERLAPDLAGMRVAYDAMHGSGRGVTDTVLVEAGAEVVRLRCEADPTFGGSAPEPTAENLGGLIERVAGGDVDLGVANDGDADRVAVVTPRGYLDPNVLFSALYEHLLEGASGPAVRTVSTTFLIDRIAEAHGEEAIETPVGFKWVAEAMAAHDALMGCEDSNGFTARGHVREKDGVLAAVLAAQVHAAQPLDERAASLFERYGEIHHVTANVDCPEGAKRHVLEAIASDPPSAFDGIPVASVSAIDGRKFLLEDGSWVLIRPSGTEAKLRVYAESSEAHRAASIADEAADHLRAHLDMVDW